MYTQKELTILQLLRKNSRATVTEIARTIGLPRSTVYDKIRKLETEGVITKYCGLVNFERLGLPVSAIIMFKSADNKAEFGNTLQKSRNVNNIFKLGNEYDYLAHAAFDSMDSMHTFLDELVVRQQVRDYKILYITKELKCEGYLSGI
jgi:DNA-binding Lrp family transcriptional regulator